ncbi:MAG: sugar ABC transporter permease [Armatimonadota bacterium]|nr:sugar ABC transporter permease [Armatimonadota bacterium]MDW8157104.1 sugar ABC transporter permease [Armatimonadota bacterium]
MSRWERWAWGLATVPAVGVLVAAFGLPLLQSVGASFVREGRFTWENYAIVYRLYRQDVLYTLGVAAGGVALTFGCGIPLAGYLRLRAWPWVEFLLKVPLFVPFVVTGHAMRVFLQPSGTLAAMLTAAGILPPGARLGIGEGWLGLVLALTWKHLALVVLLLVGAFRGVDDSYLEAAQGFGAGTFRQIWAVLVPMSATSVALALVLTLTSMLASFSIPLLMSRGSGPQMLMIDLYYRFGQHGDFEVASALGVVSYVMASGAVYAYLRSVTR